MRLIKLIQPPPPPFVSLSLYAATFSPEELLFIELAHQFGKDFNNPTPLLHLSLSLNQSSLTATDHYLIIV